MDFNSTSFARTRRQQEDHAAQKEGGGGQNNKWREPTIRRKAAVKGQWTSKNVREGWKGGKGRVDGGSERGRENKTRRRR